ncbi:MAG: alpha-amylase, partial [Glaciimonas sp.]|nr:alpha-amylase [Glaciimonas sp.]
GTALMLVPGGVQILYGDETARPEGPYTIGDRMQGTRSDMNWDSIDQTVLQHWQKMGQFRSRHIAIAAGEHHQLCQEPYVFSRHHLPSGDKLIVVLGGEGQQSIAVASIFEEGQKIQDAYSGQQLVVCHGAVTLALGEVALLEIVPT